MNNKGFTLTELLIVLIVIGIISALVIPNISKTLEQQKIKLYNKQVNQIIEITKDWSAKNIDKLPSGDDTIYVSLDTLINEKYLEQDEIIDPRDEEPISGCVSIIYDLDYNQYSFNFISKDDINYDKCNNDI